MQLVIHTSKFVHHMQVLSPDSSRYVSHSIKIPSHAQEQEHQHGTYAAGLPGICDVNLVSHTMGDDISPSARSRGICNPEKPTQGAPARQSAPRLRRNPPTATRTARRRVRGGRVFCWKVIQQPHPARPSPPEPCRHRSPPHRGRHGVPWSYLKNDSRKTGSSYELPVFNVAFSNYFQNNSKNSLKTT